MRDRALKLLTVWNISVGGRLGLNSCAEACLMDRLCFLCLELGGAFKIKSSRGNCV